MPSKSWGWVLPASWIFTEAKSNRHWTWKPVIMASWPPPSLTISSLNMNSISVRLQLFSTFISVHCWHWSIPILTAPVNSSKEQKITSLWHVDTTFLCICGLYLLTDVYYTECGGCQLNSVWQCVSPHHNRILYWVYKDFPLETT